MGKTSTPTFRIEYVESGTGRSSFRRKAQEGWQTKYAGKPTIENLRKWMEGMDASYRLGGVNHHLVQAGDEMLFVRSAKVIRQATGEVVGSRDTDALVLRPLQKVVTHG